MAWSPVTGRASLFPDAPRIVGSRVEAWAGHRVGQHGEVVRVHGRDWWIVRWDDADEERYWAAVLSTFAPVASKDAQLPYPDPGACLRCNGGGIEPDATWRCERCKGSGEEKR